MGPFRMTLATREINVQKAFVFRRQPIAELNIFTRFLFVFFTLLYGYRDKEIVTGTRFYYI